MSEWKESLSLEETNKVRVSLGLKPIADPATTAPTKTSDQLAEDNFRSRRENEQKERDTAALKAKIDKARNTKERARKLVGAGLGEDESGGVKKEEGVVEEEGADAKAWVKMQKKKAKELAKKREKEQAEADKRAEEEVAAYGEEDLKGLKVAHGQDDFEEGEETVLTLKDSRILDDDDDELHNLNISENTKTAEALALKKKGKQAGAYTGFDDDEFAEGGAAGGKSVLKKYDEEIEGKEEDGFRLGGSSSAAVVPGQKGKRKLREEEEEKEREKVKLTMEYTKSFTTDYLMEDEVGFKKPKKKKKRPATRITTADADDDEMAVEAPQQIVRTNLDDTNLIDDDDLQVSLARARREQNKKRIAEMKALAAAAPPPPPMELDDNVVKKEESDNDEGPDADGQLVMDDTSEFVRNVQLAAAKPRPPPPSDVRPKVEPGMASVAPVIKAEPEDVPLSELGGGWGQAREDGEESDDEPGDYETMALDGEESKPPVDQEDDDLIGGRELLVSKGMASTLSILRHQGLIKERSKEELDRDHQQKVRESWIARRRQAELERELDKQRSKAAGSSKDQQQREYENRLRAQRDAQEEMAAYANYKPAVNITYHDEFGRDQTPKEAWRQLSHAFHGKTNGARKTDKRLKHIADEQKREAMASGDTPLSSAAAFAARAERTGSATMVLSVGNKGSAPMQEELLGGEQRLQKASKGKGKATTSSRQNASDTAAATPVFGDIPMRPLPLPASETSRSGSPAVRSGFAPVRSFSPIGAGTSENGNGGGEKEKFIIPTTIKRKK